jgi:tRNA G10  N-methylase Trm11
VTVLAADTWRTNGHLVADIARLGYLNADDHVLDPTFGRGLWWTVWQPKHLTVHDLRIDGTDFRDLPYDDATFDAVAFDPPYVSVGGRKTTTIPDMHDRFGLTDAPTSPAGVQELINAGLTETTRVLKPKGVLLVKCQDYISSGKLWPGTHLTLNHAFTLNLNLIDRLEHIGRPRPQPPGRRQVHARRNLSTMLIFRRTR